MSASNAAQGYLYENVGMDDTGGSVSVEQPLQPGWGIIMKLPPLVSARTMATSGYIYENVGT